MYHIYRRLPQGFPANSAKIAKRPWGAENVFFIVMKTIKALIGLVGDKDRVFHIFLFLVS